MILVAWMSWLAAKVCPVAHVWGGPLNKNRRDAQARAGRLGS